MFRSILVPLDGTTFGEHALPMAACLARRTGATLHLVHVHEPPAVAMAEGIVIPDTEDLHTRMDEQAYLADAVRRVGEKEPLSTAVALIDGDVVQGLRDYARREGIDLVV